MFEKFKGANREEKKIEPKKDLKKLNFLVEGENYSGRVSSKYQVEGKKLPRPSKMLSIPPGENKVNSIKKYFVALSNRAEHLHPTDGSETHPTVLTRKRFGDKCDLGTVDSSNKNQKRMLQTVPYQSENRKQKNNKD